MKKFLAVGVILLFLGLAFAPSIIATPMSTNNLLNDTSPSKLLYTRHRQIIINGNDDLVPRNGVVGGTGTKADPYIISGWEFDGTNQYIIDKIRWKSIIHMILIFLLFGDRESALTIKDTDKYIIIRENYFINWQEPTPPPSPYGGNPRPNHRAITLKNTENIIIENNIISECNEGISSTSQIMIRNNSFFSVKGGWETVYISGQGTVVENNDFQGCADNICIYFSDAHNNTIIRNNSLKNIGGYTIIGNNGLIENNILDNCEIAIKVGNSIIRNNLVRSSTIGVASVGQNFISHNELIDNNVGVGCYWPPHNPTIVDNIIQGNHKGIYGIEGSQPSVHYNNIFENDAGLSYKGGRIINATLNWWGASNGPSGAGPGSGDSVSNDVIYSPWLTSPNPDAGR